MFSVLQLTIMMECFETPARITQFISIIFLLKKGLKVEFWLRSTCMLQICYEKYKCGIIPI